MRVVNPLQAFIWHKIGNNGDVGLRWPMEQKGLVLGCTSRCFVPLEEREVFENVRFDSYLCTLRKWLLAGEQFFSVCTEAQ
jgi:hypothetical protein